ncbi:hypothetical protein N474_16275 [Pseudoalteromonas luteoviolacea CPMOR-2]|uniref:hypothetical protein n=1 Tax=Pseudoalteromonas luteoviolacea TaxID=43657 RepID=UPI0007B06E48|nr:hypothetical protein [Pseudoalteromonas luteoviolacea]KZN55026.1 hypothetical protein N474_16275 [Pseudoalteromonas luteoviolacea CPMOR-2]
METNHNNTKQKLSDLNHCIWGDDDHQLIKPILGKACWEWALRGGGNVPNGIAADDLINRINSLFEGATQHNKNDRINAQLKNLNPMSPLYNALKPLLTDIWDSTITHGTFDEKLGEFRQRFVEIAAVSNGLTLSAQATDYKLCMKWESEDSLDWTHWGLEVCGRTVEKTPGSAVDIHRHSFTGWWLRDQTPPDERDKWLAISAYLEEKQPNFNGTVHQMRTSKYGVTECYLADLHPQQWKIIESLLSHKSHQTVKACNHNFICSGLNGQTVSSDYQKGQLVNRRWQLKGSIENLPLDEDIYKY